VVEGKDVWVDDSRPFVLIGGKRVYDFDPADYTGAKATMVVRPQSRTFIPSRITDNPFLVGTNYMSTLQSLPEPLRSQMLNGDFMAGVKDDEWQVIPTRWVELAQARWTPKAPKGEMVQMGVDVARGGDDSTTVATRHLDPQAGHDQWYDEIKAVQGADTDDGDKAASHVLVRRRDDAPINVDVIGVGASVYDSLKRANAQVMGINVAVPARRASDKSGALTFFNLRSDLWWGFRELLDPTYDSGVALPPDPKLLAELCAPRFTLSGKSIKVESREDIVKRLGYSPDRATAVILASIDQPKVAAIRAAQSQRDVLDHDPYA
jgi:hypothetical protein